MKVKVFVLFTLVSLLTQAAFAQVTSVSADTQRGYLIGPGDVVNIKVLGEPEFSVDAVTVDEDGKIQVPYSEGLTARCLTEKEVRQEIIKIYSKMIRNPQVSVYVKERNSRPPATVYGEVVTPQKIVLTRKATLRELLAVSGGIKKEASGMIQITRTQPLMCAEEKDDDWKLNSDGNLNFPSRLYSRSTLSEVNPVIYPGDIIDVQKASPVYVIGEVNKPGEIYLPEGGLPLMQAIAMAYGTTREAKIKEIKIHRRQQNSPQTDVIIANFDAIKKGTEKDLILQPLDIIEVGKSKKNIGEILFEIATGSIRNVAQTLPVMVL